MLKVSITDTLNRPLHDLRISVIDRCNFRCPYCMPKEEFSENYHFLKQKEWLNFEEIFRLTRLFVLCGVSKVRLTGGEPLLRPNLIDLIARLSKIQGIDDLALTTNGSLLFRYAQDLKQAGLQRLTVSLDSLDAGVFKTMSGGKGSLKQIKNGIKAAEEAGFKSIKINVVVQKGVNDRILLDIVQFFKNSKHVLRFIEYMDVGNCNHWQSKYVVPSAEIIQLLKKHYQLKSLPANYLGEVAKRYQLEDGPLEIGFISSITEPFCGSCTRVRLSTDGKIFTCLFADQGIDLKGPLRQGAADEQLSNLIKQTWAKREDRYSELRSKLYSSHQIPHKVEMFQIGG